MVWNNYQTGKEAVSALLVKMINGMENNPLRIFHIALSGGDAFHLLLTVWKESFAAHTPWLRIHFYWVDELYAISDEPQGSNFEEADRILLSPLHIPRTQIHPMIRKASPQEDALSYSTLMRTSLPAEDGVPVFDYVLLGISEDGHTASLFSDYPELLDCQEDCVVVQDPYKGTSHIVLTGKILINAKHTYFFAVGKQQNSVIRKVIEENTTEYSASYVFHSARVSELFTAI